MVPERSVEAQSATSVFFEEYNDIDIYVEDSSHGYGKIFVELFSRLFYGKYRVSKVFPLGGKGEVVRECRKWQGSFSRPSLYVVDGDLSLVNEAEEDELDGLYCLPVYCIENVLIDKDAIIDVLNEEDVVKLREQIVEEFDFDGWVESNEEVMAELFAEYATCFYFCPEHPTVSYPVNSLVSSNKGVLDINKVERRVQEIKEIVVGKVGEEDYRERRGVILRKIKENSETVLKFSSGKDYLIPLLFTRSRAVVNTRISNVNFKLRLAMKCDLSYLEGSERCIAG